MVELKAQESDGYVTARSRPSMQHLRWASLPYMHPYLLHLHTLQAAVLKIIFFSGSGTRLRIIESAYISACGMTATTPRVMIRVVSRVRAVIAHDCLCDNVCLASDVKSDTLQPKRRMMPINWAFYLMSMKIDTLCWDVAHHRCPKYPLQEISEGGTRAEVVCNTPVEFCLFFCSTGRMPK